ASARVVPCRVTTAPPSPFFRRLCRLVADGDESLFFPFFFFLLFIPFDFILVDCLVNYMVDCLIDCLVDCVGFVVVLVVCVWVSMVAGFRRVYFG
ncbi:hypothetical protein Tsubulata_043294, partial [Turnera subulata]